MKKMLRFLGILILFTAGFLYLWPFLRYPAFNVIDDGASLRASQDLLSDVQHGNLNHWPSILIETQDGRLRPLYHLFYFSIYALFGPQPIFFWIGQSLLLSATLVLSGIFVFLVTKRWWLSVLAPLALVFFSSTAENFYRLGTAEPKQMVAWLIFLLWCWWVSETGWTVKTMFAGILALGVSLLTKETSITFVAMYWAFWLWQILFTKQRSRESILYGLTIGMLGSSYVFLLPIRTGYNTAFLFQLRDMWLRLLYSRESHAVLYFCFVMSAFLTAARWVFELAIQQNKSQKKSLKFPDQKNYRWQILLMIQAVILLVIGILPWQWTLVRYFYPLYVMVIIQVALEISAWISFFPKFKKAGFGWQLFLANTLIIFALLFQQFILLTAKNLSLNVHDIKFRILVNRLDMAELWLPLLLAVCALCLRVIIKKGQHEKIDWSEYFWPGWLLGAIALTLFFSSLIWTTQNFNAYILVTILVIIFVCAEVHIWWSWFISKNHPPYIFLSSLSLLIIFGAILHQKLFQTWWGDPIRYVHSSIEAAKFSFDTYQISYGAIRYLLTEVPPNTHIYVFENEYEIIFEFGLYASHFRQKPIQLFTNSAQLVADVGKDYPYLQYTPDTVGSYAKDKNPKILIIRQMGWQPIVNSDSIATISGKVQSLPPRLSYGTFPEKVFWEAVR